MGRRRLQPQLRGLVLAAGSLSDRYGRRPALLIGLFGFAATSALGALAIGTGALVTARFSMGVFAALIFPTTLSIITNTFSGRQRATALGGWGAVVGVWSSTGTLFVEQRPLGTPYSLRRRLSS
jgi:MFS family permease